MHIKYVYIFNYYYNYKYKDQILKNLQELKLELYYKTMLLLD